MSSVVIKTSGGMRLLVGGLGVLGSCVFLVLAGGSTSPWGLLALVPGAAFLYLTFMMVSRSVTCTYEAVIARMTLVTQTIPREDIQLLTFEDAEGRFDIVLKNGRWISLPYGFRSLNPRRVSRRVAASVQALRSIYGTELPITSGRDPLPSLTRDQAPTFTSRVSRPSHPLSVFLGIWLVAGIVTVFANAK